MTDLNRIYQLKRAVKGWPVKGATTLKHASELIFGSPYWRIPEDSYMVIDKNDTYSLLALVSEGEVDPETRYMVVNMDFIDNCLL